MDEVLALVAKLLARNGELERKLADALTRGRKNEGVSAAQLLLMLEGLAAAPVEDLEAANRQLRQASAIDEERDEAAEAEPQPRKQPPLRRPLPPELRRVENPIPVPAGERPCPKCGAERKCIGHDVTEVIDLVPAEVIVRLDQREKLACRDCEAEVVRAPPGDKVVPGGRMGTTLVAQVLVDKYRDGLPLHRQKARFERLGVKLPVSTLADQVAWGADLLRPVWRAAMDAVLASVIMHLDATGLPVLDDSKAGGLKLGTLWGYVVPHGAAGGVPVADFRDTTLATVDFGIFIAMAISRMLCPIGPGAKDRAAAGQAEALGATAIGGTHERTYWQIRS